MSYPSEDQIKFWMREALVDANVALGDNEIPIACKIVDIETNKLISSAYNATNRAQNGTRHCEFEALSFVYKHYPNPKQLLSQCFLVVSVEPCIMCATALDNSGLRGAFFGCFNDRFGGCGSIITALSNTFICKGGYYAKEAIALLKEFYGRGNPKAPENKRRRPIKEPIVELESVKNGDMSLAVNGKSAIQKPSSSSQSSHAIALNRSSSPPDKTFKVENRKEESDHNGATIDPSKVAIASPLFNVQTSNLMSYTSSVTRIPEQYHVSGGGTLFSAQTSTVNQFNESWNAYPDIIPHIQSVCQKVIE